MDPFKKVLLIICDQWRFRQHWPDESVLPLPNYQRLRDNGIEFTNAYISSTACNASRACIFAGKYGRETGTTSTSGFHLSENVSFGYEPTEPKCSLAKPPHIWTIGHHFQQNHFNTVYKGKWHLSDAEGMWPEQGRATGLEDYGFSGWRPPEGHGDTALRMGFGADAAYVQDAIQSIYDLRSKDWFLVCSIINPHDIGLFTHWKTKIPDFDLTDPCNVSDDLEQKPKCQTEVRRLWNALTFMPKEASNVGPNDELRISEDEWRSYINLYAHLTQIADFQMGMLIDELENTEQLEDTLIVFLSDHGEMGRAHGMTQKFYQAYEETIHVPFVFSNPRLVDALPRATRKKKQRNDSMVNLIDLAPTLLSMCGIEQPTEERRNLRGVDLRPILLGETDSVQDAVLFATDDDITEFVSEKAPRSKIIPVSQPNRIRTIRTRAKIGSSKVANWKLSRYVDPDENDDVTEYELYNLDEDPGEMTNLAVNRDHKTTLDALDQQLEELLIQKYRFDCLAPKSSPPSTRRANR